MHLISAQARPHGPADPNNFVLPALMQPLVGPDDQLPVRLYRVSFGLGARTHWHHHDEVQILVGVSGTCVVANREGTEVHLMPGDAVVIPAGEEHWHGSAPGCKGEHLGVNTGRKTTWLEPVE